MREKNNEEIYSNLNIELAYAGAPTDYHLSFDDRILSPLSAIVNGPFSVLPYVDIILKYSNMLDPNGKSFCARALTEKGVKGATGFLLSLYRDYTPDDMDLWAVGNALYVINDKASYGEIVDICRNKKYGSSRQMLMGMLSRMKNQEAFNVLVDCLNDESVRAHAIEAIGKFGDVSAIPMLEKLSVKKGMYEFKARETALRRLKRIRND